MKNFIEVHEYIGHSLITINIDSIVSVIQGSKDLPKYNSTSIILKENITIKPDETYEQILDKIKIAQEDVNPIPPYVGKRADTPVIDEKHTIDWNYLLKDDYWSRFWELEKKLNPNKEPSITPNDIPAGPQITCDTIGDNNGTK